MKYRNGSIAIDVDKFFPTSKPRIRKLLKIMDMDDRERTEELLQLMDERVEGVRAGIKEGNLAAGAYKKILEDRQARVEKLERLLETQKSCGVGREVLTETREKLKAAREAKAEVGAEYRNLEKRLTKLRKEGIALLGDVEFIRKETGREE